MGPGAGLISSAVAGHRVTLSPCRQLPQNLGTVLYSKYFRGDGARAGSAGFSGVGTGVWKSSASSALNVNLPGSTAEPLPRVNLLSPMSLIQAARCTCITETSSTTTYLPTYLPCSTALKKRCRVLSHHYHALALLL